jgi:hypothetical protein
MNDTNNKPPKSNKQIEQIEQIKPKLYNFMIIIIVIFFIILFLLLFNYLGKSNSQSIQTSPMNQLGSSIATPVVNSVINTTQSAANQLMEYQYPKPNKPSILGIILNLLYFILFVILILLFIKYAFNIDVLKAFKKKQDSPKASSEKAKKANKAKNSEEDEEDEDEDASNPNSIKTTIKNFSPKLPYKEVYHIPGNNYSYEEAKSVCKAYDGELANIKQMEDVYKKGGEWCSYGWSDNQLALFPTQHEHWNKLQTIKGHEHDCGRPGINGGYIDNPNVRFGVNCYGFKPKMKPVENKLMESASEYPITDQQVEFNKQVDHWKKNLNTIIVAPFNAKKWSGTEL